MNELERAKKLFLEKHPEEKSDIYLWNKVLTWWSDNKEKYRKERGLLELKELSKVQQLVFENWLSKL
jgi:hypothetical protein